MTQYLTADAEVPLPLRVQVLEQIKWLVAFGLLKPGDLLVPAAQLADRLHVNRNTIQAIYAQLREEGIVETRKGFGTWLQDSPGVRSVVEERDERGGFLRQAFELAAEKGFDPARFARMSAASLQLHAKFSMPKWLLVASESEEYGLVRDEIERLTGAKPEVLLLEQVGDGETPPDMPRFDRAVATLSCADEARRLLPGIGEQLLAVEPVISPAAQFEIARSDDWEDICFVAAGRRGADWIDGQLQAMGAACDAIALTDGERLRLSLRKAKTVYAAPSAFEAVLTLAPDKVRPLACELDRSSVYRLAQYHSPLMTR